MISASELRTVPLFSSLPDAEATALAARLADVHLREGDWLLHEGEQPSFFMLINGEIEVRKMVHGADRRINIYQPGEYSASCRCCSALPLSPACVHCNPRALHGSIRPISPSSSAPAQAFPQSSRRR
jgi:hypothetical protein